MLKRYLVLLSFAAAVAHGQSRVDLLRRASNYYNDQGSFDVKGVTTAKAPGTSWQFTYDFETEAAQPRFIPVGLRRNSMQAVMSTSNLRTTRVVADATDPRPDRRIFIRPFVSLEKLANRLLDAQRIGVETVTYQGRNYQCEIVDATYDTSPDFKPNSATFHRKIYIDPETLWVLKITEPEPYVGEWTLTVTSLTFDQPPSEGLIQSLDRFQNPRTTRPEWKGREAPDIALNDLSGNRVRLAELRGHAVLLDFWGSYCAPCKRATALSEQLAAAYRDAGLIVWGVTQDTVDDARLWLNFNHLTLPALLDRDGAAYRAFEVEGVPVAILIDGQGKVVKYWEGEEAKSDVQTAVEQVLQRRK
ncbi:MAG TPA: TlpA disulfide reductase family protein [Bryobacteraceae bacterium]|jgi:peroxiredoxin|nr:TlpA disulfide reductase family protein [Bryobacteraceae bacterium]